MGPFIFNFPVSHQYPRLFSRLPASICIFIYLLLPSRHTNTHNLLSLGHISSQKILFLQNPGSSLYALSYFLILAVSNNPKWSDMLCQVLSELRKPNVFESVVIRLLSKFFSLCTPSTVSCLQLSQQIGTWYLLTFITYITCGFFYGYILLPTREVSGLEKLISYFFYSWNLIATWLCRKHTSLSRDTLGPLTRRIVGSKVMFDGKESTFFQETLLALSDFFPSLSLSPKFVLPLGIRNLSNEVVPHTAGCSFIFSLLHIGCLYSYP